MESDFAGVADTSARKLGVQNTPGMEIDESTVLIELAGQRNLRTLAFDEVSITHRRSYDGEFGWVVQNRLAVWR
jgi:hypothetical protein